MTTLLDSNVLVALAVDDHVHHVPAARWFAARTEGFATCPITQGAVVRAVLRTGQTSASAIVFLTALTARSQHEFWPDDLAYSDARIETVIGHRQVTAAYLAALAHARHGRVATIDAGFVGLHGDVAELVPTQTS
jgi:toxin-antitoxin system PIN domain toxin